MGGLPWRQSELCSCKVCCGLNISSFPSASLGRGCDSFYLLPLFPAHGHCFSSQSHCNAALSFPLLDCRVAVYLSTQSITRKVAVMISAPSSFEVLVTDS